MRKAKPIKDVFFDERYDRGKDLIIQKTDDVLQSIITPIFEKKLDKKIISWIKFEGFSNKKRVKSEYKIVISLYEKGFYITQNVVAIDQKNANKNLIRWPYCIYVKNFKYIDTELIYGISLIDAFRDIDDATYPESKQRQCTFEEVRKIHS